MVAISKIKSPFFKSLGYCSKAEAVNLLKNYNVNTKALLTEDDLKTKLQELYEKRGNGNFGIKDSPDDYTKPTKAKMPIRFTPLAKEYAKPINKKIEAKILKYEQRDRDQEQRNRYQEQRNIDQLNEERDRDQLNEQLLRDREQHEYKTENMKKEMIEKQRKQEQAEEDRKAAVNKLKEDNDQIIIEEDKASKRRKEIEDQLFIDNENDRLRKEATTKRLKKEEDEQKHRDLMDEAFREQIKQVERNRDLKKEENDFYEKNRKIIKSYENRKKPKMSKKKHDNLLSGFYVEERTRKSTSNKETRLYNEYKNAKRAIGEGEDVEDLNDYDEDNELKEEKNMIKVTRSMIQAFITNMKRLKKVIPQEEEYQKYYQQVRTMIEVYNSNTKEKKIGVVDRDTIPKMFKLPKKAAFFDIKLEED